MSRLLSTFAAVAVMSFPTVSDSHDASPSWAYVGVSADWGGMDRAYSSGDTPKETVQGYALCDHAHIGFVATCWSDRPNGYPPGNLPTDIIDASGHPLPAWCTYKDNRVNILTPQAQSSQSSLHTEGRASGPA